MFEWLFLGLLVLGFAWMLYRRWRRKRAGEVPLRVDDFKVTVLSSDEAVFSFRVSRRDLERLVKAMAVSRVGLLDRFRGGLQKYAVQKPKRKRGRPPKTVVEPRQPKPSCFGELGLGLPAKPECQVCGWSQACVKKKVEYAM